MLTIYKTLHAPLNRPYYIESLKYDKRYAGVCALHLLCHALNISGEEAYVYTDDINPKLYTPKLTEDVIRQHKAENREPIVIYPEIIHGNPRNARSVVRYVLNYPGLVGGPKKFHESDLLCYFGLEFSDGFDWQSQLYLRIPLVDQSVFYNKKQFKAEERKGFLFYPGRYPNGLEEFSEIVQRSTIITYQWPETQKEIAELFRKSELLYCVTNSAIITEALLCGCPVVLLSTPHTAEFIAQNQKALIENNIIPFGIALNNSLSEIERAKATVNDFEMRYNQLEVNFWNNLKTFIERTQAMPIQDEPGDLIETPRVITVSHNNKSVLSNCDEKSERTFDYAIWCQKHALTEAKKRILTERSENWREYPNFLLITVCEGSKLEALQETIESLDQQVYSQWSLVILATEPCPLDNVVEHPMAHWIQCDDDSYQAINHVLAVADEFTWVAVIDMGDRLAPETLCLFTDYINLKPEWSFIYCDEDSYKVTANAYANDKSYQYSEPKLKPDINIDWLRSEPYIGSFCLTRKRVLDELNGYCGLAGVLNWDMALQVLDKSGATTIGHIPEILLHTQDKHITELEQQYLEQAGAEVLDRHFQRNGIQAQISQGFVKSSYLIDYTLSRTPSVTIVIVVANAMQAENLPACLNSLFEKTSYKCFEIVLALGPVAESIKDLVVDVDTKGISIRIIDGVNTLSNALINGLNSELMLFLNPDLTLIHEYWLERLVGHALREEIGAVSARIVHSDKTLYHAGIILGMGEFGVADKLNYQLPLNSPGYINRALVTQNFSAVSLDCLLIKTALLRGILSVGPIADNEFLEVELSLRIRQRGLLIVWTPHVSLLMQKQTKIKAKYEQNRKDADAFLHKWLPDLAQDPHFNRHLSLKYRQCQIEIETDVTWNVDFHDRLRVYAFPANETGVGEYRVRAPLRALSHEAMIQSSLLPNHSATLIPDIVEIERVKPDVMLLQNGTADYLIHAWEQYRKFNDVFMIYSQDDLVFALPGKHPLQKIWPKDMRKRLRKQMECSDRLIVATESLQEAYRRWISDIRVVPNYLEKTRWLNLDVKAKAERKKLRVGWAGGAQHHGDLEFMLPVVEATKNEIDWIFMGMCPEQIRPFIREYHGGVAFDLYPQKLAGLDLDLAIAPLEYNNFNMAKTNLRLLEYGVLGWPVICSDITPYQNAPVTRVANNVHQWVKAIREKINEPVALAKEGQQLKQWVVDHYMLEDHLDEWLEALKP